MYPLLVKGYNHAINVERARQMPETWFIFGALFSCHGYRIGTAGAVFHRKEGVIEAGQKKAGELRLEHPKLHPAKGL